MSEALALMAPHKSKNSTKRTLKFIARCQHRDIIEHILRKADSIIGESYRQRCVQRDPRQSSLVAWAEAPFFQVSIRVGGSNRSRYITSKETENCPEWWSPPDSWSNLASCNWISYFNRWKCDF